MIFMPAQGNYFEYYALTVLLLATAVFTVVGYHTAAEVHGR